MEELRWKGREGVEARPMKGCISESVRNGKNWILEELKLREGHLMKLKKEEKNSGKDKKKADTWRWISESQILKEAEEIGIKEE